MNRGVGLSAFDEIGQRADAGGTETIRLLRQLGAQVTRMSSFPPPSGYATWSEAAVDDLLADMFSQENRSQVFVLACYMQATDQASLERLILQSIRNFLIDQAKGTERGKLRRRLDNLLTKDSRFTRPPDLKGIRAWALLNRLFDLWQGDIDFLHLAAARIRGYQILRWNTAGKTPQQTVTALTEVCYGVIDHAAGSVRDEDLAKVVERRFALLAPPVFVEIPDGSSITSAEYCAVTGDEPLSNLGAHTRAEEILATLGREEQALLPFLGSSMDERRAATGLGRATTQALGDALADRLRLATVDDEDRQEIVLRIVELVTQGSESGRLSQVGSHMPKSLREEAM
ncbi:hypothetical protein [Leucobacter sp. W1478]|uniref:hypothetical protein n=1 Tax=Leucobacter sp. W1478 TaxID=3439065 RepID=UPI003F33B65E